jgi:c-di-GMP-binding flagellar brake protein YcgR
MAASGIKAGDRLEIIVEKRVPIIWKEAYTSKIEEVLDKDRILIQAPMQKGRLVRLTLGSLYTIRVNTGSGFLQYEARATEHLREGRIDLLVLSLASQGEKTQRRDFFRYNCAIGMQFYILDDNGEPVGTSTHEGLIRDVGGGGMRLASNERIPDKAIIRFTLPLPRDELMIFGQVLRGEHNAGSVHAYQYRVRFTAMSAAEQDKLVQFIYHEQRRNLQKL